MSTIALQLTSNASEIIRQVESFPPRMAQAIAKALDKENELTVGYIQATKLSRRSATTLGVVTNRLRSSLRPSRAIVSGKVIESAIGSNVVYAGAHEFGVDRLVPVRGFSRHNPRADVTSAEASEFNPKSGKIRKIKARLTASGVSRVRPFNRHMQMPERSYIRKGITDRADRYSVTLSATIVETWNTPEATP